MYLKTVLFLLFLFIVNSYAKNSIIVHWNSPANSKIDAGVGDTISFYSSDGKSHTVVSSDGSISGGPISGSASNPGIFTTTLKSEGSLTIKSTGEDMTCTIQVGPATTGGGSSTTGTTGEPSSTTTGGGSSTTGTPTPTPSDTPTPTPSDTPTPSPSDECNLKVVQEITPGWETENETYSFVQVVMTNEGASPITGLTISPDNPEKIFHVWEFVKSGDQITPPSYREVFPLNPSVALNFGYIATQASPIGLNVKAECGGGSTTGSSTTGEPTTTGTTSTTGGSTTGEPTTTGTTSTTGGSTTGEPTTTGTTSTTGEPTTTGITSTTGEPTTTGTTSTTGEPTTTGGSTTGEPTTTGTTSTTGGSTTGEPTTTSGSSTTGTPTPTPSDTPTPTPSDTPTPTPSDTPTPTPSQGTNCSHEITQTVVTKWVNSEKYHFTQVDVTIKNTGDTSIVAFNFTISNLDHIWRVERVGKDDSFGLPSYQQTISPGEQFNFGYIVNDDKEAVLENLSVKC
eukprot:gene7765-9557_t